MAVIVAVSRAASHTFSTTGCLNIRPLAGLGVEGEAIGIGLPMEPHRALAVV